MHTDRFACIDAKTLLRWILADLDRGECFGIEKGLFFTPKADDPFRMERYGKVLETPFGVAAGPHTQLAQNLIAAWLTGARYMELKTIQVLDELDVTKPCIDMKDEGYNCEWSQELKLNQSYNEYLKAFVLLYVLRHRLGLPLEAETGKGPGFIFNMSAGYNLEGIKSPTVQNFFDRMENCAADVERLKAELAEIYPAIKDIAIPGRMSDNLTVSTMHGCPPDEVEKIGMYFVTERKYNTTIKLNPTLLGAERLRGILNGKLGFPTHVPDEAFGHDLKYADGVNILKNLTAAAARTGVAFGIKLTNTLETANRHQNLPKKEGMVYMSGRALHPVSINLAATLQKEFDGKLDISFSAGVDACNVADTLACGVRPVTVSSDLLKPGGYARMTQYADTLRQTMKAEGAGSLADLSARRGGAMGWLNAYAEKVTAPDSRYRKDAFPFPGMKNKRALPRFDCAQAPCVTACPTSQDVPRYMDAVAHGDYETAWQVILATNPFPYTQGMVCDHKCQSACTRMNYDAPLLIREIKRFVAEQFKGKGTGLHAGTDTGLTAAIIGAGPSGLSCAHFLALAGVKVTVYEAKGLPGGMAGDAIPAFRLSREDLDRDIKAILDLGVTLKTGTRVDAALFEQLHKANDLVYVAVGAQQSTPLGIPGEKAPGVLDQLAFLSAVRQGKAPALGKKVLVVGAGNSAMDVARAARRLVGKDGEVTIVYRRTRAEMPADPEEIHGALEEGVVIRELCGPEEVLLRDGAFAGLKTCCMTLVDDEKGGRPKPVAKPGEFCEFAADTLIVSIGQKVVADFLPGGLASDPATFRTDLCGVFAGGDAARGASSLINAVGDGRKAAEAMLRSRGLVPAETVPCDQRKTDLHTLRLKQAKRIFGPKPAEKAPLERLDFNPFMSTLSEKDARQEAGRCLQCDRMCNICVTVCPNRANLALRVAPMRFPVQRAVSTADGVRVETVASKCISQPYQVFNLADACNECGNCAAFCPSADAPYLTKPRLHLSEADFRQAPEGFRMADRTRLEARYAGKDASLTAIKGGFVYEDAAMKVDLCGTSFCARSVELKSGTEADLSRAVEMAVIFRILENRRPFVL